MIEERDKREYGQWVGKEDVSSLKRRWQWLEMRYWYAPVGVSL